MGKARITGKNTLDGKNYKNSRTSIVQKYPNPIKSLEINNKKVSIETYGYVKIIYTLAKGKKKFS